MDIYVSCHSDNNSTTSPNVRIDGFFLGIPSAEPISALWRHCRQSTGNFGVDLFKGIKDKALIQNQFPLPPNKVLQSLNCNNIHDNSCHQ